MDYYQYQEQCYETGEIPCSDASGHSWVVSDDDENVCYCDKCGCSEY